MWLAKSVIPECNIDSSLFNVLLEFGKDGVNHTKGNTTVVKKVVEKFDNLFCVAIIDKDRRDIDFISNDCVKIDLEGVEEYFKLFKRKEKHHYFIQMVPAIEEWMIEVAGDLGIMFNDFGINAATLNELKYITKTTASKNDERFKKLFREIVRKSEEIKFKPVLKLKNIVLYILEKQYSVDINELKNI
jgi:hypothetical protein